MMRASHPFHIMTKPTGAICNLDCTYCFYLEKEKLYPATTNFGMNDDVLENYIRQHIETQPTESIAFAWQGGEPTLLGVDFFKRAVELQNKYCEQRQIVNAFQTNGILLNDEWATFFNEHDFLIGISIDGPEHLHDKYRLNKGGSSSFKQVMRGLEYLKKHSVEFNTLTVVHHENAGYPLEIYNFLKDAGSQYMQFIPIVERVTNNPDRELLKLVKPDYSGSAMVTEWSVTADQYGKFLCSIFDEWVRKDVAQYYIQIFDVALEAWFGMQPNLCVFREECGDAMALEHNGDLYSCDHYVYPDNKLGNIMEAPLLSLIDSPQQKKFGQDKKTTLPEYCKQCEVRFACNGECPKHRFIKTPDGEDGLNYLCGAYKMFFNHINPYMKYMANELKEERAPANVMQWAKEKDNGFPSLRPGPNEPCPCGSGKKYKKCCAIV